MSANISLHREIDERKRVEEEREKLIIELQEALDKVKTLSGLLPICSSCKKRTEIVREDRETEITLDDDNKPIKAETVF